MSRRTSILLALAALSLALVATGDARAQSAAAAGTAANVWVLDEDGETVATYNVGVGEWTENAGQLADQAVINHTGGLSFIGFDPDDFEAVMINEVPNGLPLLGAGVPSVSLAGLGLAQADVATTDTPSVSVSPAPGSYDETIEVLLEALPPPGYVPTSLRLFWSVNGGTEQSALNPARASVYLVADGVHTIDVRAVATQGFSQFPSPVTSVDFTIAGAGPITRDTDGDGVPDIVEAEWGSNPLTADFSVDSDGDGWSDFEERVRGTDPHDPSDAPLDSDGDGWSDFDEGVRGTNPNDPPHLVDPGDPDRYFPDKPTARRLREVEWIWSGDFYTGNGPIFANQTPMGGLTVLAPQWDSFFDQADVPTADELADLGLLENELPVHLRESVVMGDLAGGALPPLRTPAGDANLVQAGRLDVEGQRDGWTTAAWVDAVPDLDPGEVTAFLAGQGESFADAAEWLAGYVDYLTANAVRPLAVAVTPRTTAALALLDGLVAWHAQLEPSAVVLLGDPDTDAEPAEAVEALALSLGEDEEDGRSLGALHTELAAQLGPGGVLAAFDAAATGVFNGFDPLTASYGSETRRSLAALLQGVPGDDDPVAQYLSRLYTVYSQAELDALDPGELAALLDPAGDFDSDGVANEDELIDPEVVASAVDAPNSDGDLYADADDPCPAQADNACLNEGPLATDSDLDGVIDPLDNCPNVPNADQLDSIGNEVGDACRYFAVIEQPSFHPTVLVGATVAFRSRRGMPFGLDLFTYDWDFGDGQSSGEAQPPEIVYGEPGNYLVTLTVTNLLMDSTLDFRFVNVVGSAPFVEAGGPYAVVEGDPLQLTANAVSPNGGIADYDWDFGDGQMGAGNPVEHVWAQDGDYQATVTVEDGAGLQVADVADVTVQDTAPSASFGVAPGQGFAPLTVQFTDTSTAYDGIDTRQWDFGDGSPLSMQVSPSHEYTGRGLYETELVVHDGDGTTAQAMQTVAVSSGLNLLDDVDDDGMADVWEGTQGLSVGADDSGGNGDGDVATNVEEHRTGTLAFDGGSAPEGPGPSYVLFRDVFEDGVFDDRWSIGLESPLAESVVQEGASIAFDLVRPDVESCSTASLVSFPTFTATNAVLRARFTLSGSGELCVGWIADEDFRQRIDVCQTDPLLGTWTARLRRLVGGAATLQGAGSSVADQSVEIRISKQGATFAAWQDGLPLGELDSPALDAAALRPMLSPAVCQAHAGDFAGVIDWIEVLRDGDGDGLGDLEEDLDADGVVDPGETDPDDPDGDGDGALDGADNCSTVSNANQLDSDGDGFGNACDLDLDGNGVVGIADFNRLRNAFGATCGDPEYDPAVDVDGDCAIGILEFNVLRSYFAAAPGPSGLPCAAAGTCGNP